MTRASFVLSARPTLATATRRVLTFDWQGRQLQFLAAVVEVLDGEIPGNVHARTTDQRNPGMLSHILQNKPHWTEYELRAEGMPLYLSDDWLLDQHRRVQTDPKLRRMGTATYIEKRYGYSNQSISRRLIGLGIETRPRNTDKQRERVRFLLAEGGHSYTEIAKEVGVSKATVTRIAREME